MRLIDRLDASLVSALLLVTFVLFNRPLQFILDIITEVDNKHDLNLLPALIVVTIAFAFHEYRNYIDAAADLRRAQTHSEGVERLLELSSALARSVDDAGVCQTLNRYLPSFCADRGYWMLRRQNAAWEPVLQDALSMLPGALESQSAAARHVAADERSGSATGIAVENDMCFPLVARAGFVGVLGIRNDPPLTTGESQALTKAASIIALALRNVQVINEAHERGVYDDLTGCMARAPGLARLDTEMRRTRRTLRPLAVLLFDIDHFKEINDSRGHVIGDRTLAFVGERLQRILRVSDVRCRYGGDEFLVVLPDTPYEGAALVAEKIRVGVLDRAPTQTDLPQVTLSVGAAMATPGDSDVLGLINRADQALYRAKRAGKNRTCFSEEQVVPVRETGPSATIDLNRDSEDSSQHEGPRLIHGGGPPALQRLREAPPTLRLAEAEGASEIDPRARQDGPRGTNPAVVGDPQRARHG